MGLPTADSACFLHVLLLICLHMNMLVVVVKCWRYRNTVHSCQREYTVEICTANSIHRFRSLTNCWTWIFFSHPLCSHHFLVLGRCIIKLCDCDANDIIRIEKCMNEIELEREQANWSYIWRKKNTFQGC